MKKNFKLLILVSLVGLLLIALYMCSKNEKVHENEIALMEENEVAMPQVRNVVYGYRRERVTMSSIPKETPTDEGFLVVEGNDSIEICTDIMSGQPYRIVIESSRQTPFCKLFNEAGDSLEWDYAVQAIRFTNDSTYYPARLMVADNMFPFGISENIDSINETRFCDISFAEIVNNSQDSIHSGSVRFPIFGAATILFCTASQQSDKLYLKVVHPGLLSVVVVYDESVCGYPLFWDHESAVFEGGNQEEILNASSDDDSSDEVLMTDF